ncbi:hypothetical protein Q4595_27590, partial [Wenyingzhuangia sp. 1_MG-2023]|nr:hypothetical protein [Wenyingzhuangia sp. 1_MG-2023]
LIQLRNRSGWLRRMVDPVMGLNPAVKLPVRSPKRLEALTSPAVAGNLNGHKVAMFVDTFTRYYEPHIVEAAITVLEAGGYQVRLLQP